MKLCIESGLSMYTAGQLSNSSVILQFPLPQPHNMWDHSIDFDQFLFSNFSEDVN